MAAEGGLSHYLPGTPGDLAIAQSPAPGLQMDNTLWYQNGSVDAAVLQGAVNLDLDVDIVLNLLATSYIFEREILGGTYTVGALIPFGYAELSATVVAPGGGQRQAEQSSFNLSDAAFVPAQLNWSLGNFSLKLAEVIIAPTGAYDVDEVVNLGRNYWSFDTVGVMTWLDRAIGTELSPAPGLMYNTKNDDTDYQTGIELHLDFTGNPFVTETLAVACAAIGTSRSATAAATVPSSAASARKHSASAPASSGLPNSPILGRWMHDFETDNRFESDDFTLTGAWKFEEWVYQIDEVQARLWIAMGAPPDIATPIP